MSEIRAKKKLGQHFLKDGGIALDIVNSLVLPAECKRVLEIGPGTGILTRILYRRFLQDLSAIDIDPESIAFLKKTMPELEDRLIQGDFLSMNLDSVFAEPFAVIGNFPYNISTQILFKVLASKNKIPVVVGMFQKEVAERIASEPGSKVYGIVSVLLQAFYRIEYLFTVHEDVFEPPPKVKSAVIRLTRNDVQDLGCRHDLFVKVVKASFNQRRKMLRNGLRQFKLKPQFVSHPFLSLRAERLSVKDFIELTNMLEQ
jgi:16S rRNA (adenine1518-N6/adenine1519-N6)-dimethyltransferase